MCQTDSKSPALPVTGSRLGADSVSVTEVRCGSCTAATLQVSDDGTRGQRGKNWRAPSLNLGEMPRAVGCLVD